MIEQFLKQLTTVATSPYAFVAYVVLVIVWAIVVVQTRRLSTISRNLGLVPEADRKSILEKDYGFHLKEGMSARDFLKAQRTTYVFYAFVAVVLTALIISVLAILRAKTDPVDLRRAEFQNVVRQIISSIDSDFTSIKGTLSRGDSDNETDVFESKILLPGSFYNYIEFEHDDVPAFLATLYHGEDPIIAFNVYHDLIQELRLVVADWIPHERFMDPEEPKVSDTGEKPLADYVSFVKGDKKIIVSLDSGEKIPREWHVNVMFKKVSNKPDL